MVSITLSCSLYILSSWVDISSYILYIHILNNTGSENNLLTSSLFPMPSMFIVFFRCSSISPRVGGDFPKVSIWSVGMFFGNWPNALPVRRLLPSKLSWRGPPSKQIWTSNNYDIIMPGWTFKFGICLQNEWAIFCILTVLEYVLLSFFLATV